ncbi:MAG: thiamine diphosphokinase [Ignavibacteria bacterium]|nr:thiamine diphosphokinase [Ignavibacteria bacterium]
MKKCIILANGEKPKKNIYKYLESIGYSILICADGGANTALNQKIIPDYIIGDLDSIKPKTYDFFYDKCRIIKSKNQNNTDVEKCLVYAIKNKFSNAILLGGIGNRLDHSLCNISILLKYHDSINIRLINKNSILMVYDSSVSLITKKNELISIFGFDKKTKITSNGLKYALNNDVLPFGTRESTSNQALGNEVKLNIKGGKIIVIREYEILKKYDLI